MFIKKPVIRRSSWHYKFWTWTWRNQIWKKRVPAISSICAYCQRMFWIGILMLPPLHLAYYLLVFPIHDLLYKKVAYPVLKNNTMAALAIWVLILGVPFALKGELFLALIVTGILYVVTVTILIMLVVFLTAEYLKDSIEAALDATFGAIGMAFSRFGKFNWEIYRRYYAPKYRLDPNKYTLEHGRNQLWLHLIFWLQYLLLAFVLYFAGGKSIVPEEISGGSGLLVWTLAFLLCYYTLFTLIALWALNVMEREELYRQHPELMPKKPEKPVAKAKKRTWLDSVLEGIEEGWDLFCTWLKATKERVCPLVEFVD